LRPADWGSELPVHRTYDRLVVFTSETLRGVPRQNGPVGAVFFPDGFFQIDCSL
jgi:hypothetical protein